MAEEGAWGAGSCLRRNDGREGRGVTEGAVAWTIEVWTVMVDARGLPPPHLTSPLEGGRDEFGKRGAEVDGRAWVPAYAGMTEEGGAGMTEGECGFLPAQE